MQMIDEMLEKAPFLRLDEEVATRLLTTALREEVNKAGFDKVIVGLSGESTLLCPCICVSKLSERKT